MIRLRSPNAALWAFAALLPLARAAHAQEDPERVLRDLADPSRNEIEQLQSGEALVKTLDSDDARELTQVYAVRIAAPTSFVLSHIRERHLLLDDAENEQARGIFSSPPVAGDLDRLQLPRASVRALRDCEPQACDVKLPLELIERLQTTVDWSSRAATDQANAFFRVAMGEILDSYRTNGIGDFAYADKREPLFVGQGFQRIFESADEFAVAPRLGAYLADYPASRVAGIEESFRWTIEDLGMKTLVSLNHVTFWPTDGSDVSVIASKRFYSAHYFQAALRLIVVAPARNSDDSVVLVVDRRRFDGELGGLRRVATERRLERHVEAVLTATKNEVEAARAN